MPSPSIAELDSQLQSAVDLLENTLSVLTCETDLDAYSALVESEFAAAQIASAENFVSAVGDALRRGGDVLGQVFLAYCYHGANAPTNDVITAFDRVYDYFVAQNKRIKSRGVTFGAYSGSTTGTGVINRVTKDWSNYDIESVTFEVKTAQIVADAQSQADPFEEVFQFRGYPRKPYAITINGSGITQSIRNASARDSLLANPSFEVATWATAPSAGSPQVPTAVDSWTVDTIAKTQSDADIFYKRYRSQTLPLSLRFNTSGGNCNNGIQQLLSVNGVGVQRYTPYHLEVAVYRAANADGTITLTLGSQSTAVDLTTLTNSAWNVVRLSTGADAKPWPTVWNQNGALVRVAVTSNTTGTVYLDDVLLVPYVALDGAWVLPVAGATAWVLNDTKTSTDALTATDSKIQKWLWRSFTRILPHTPNATQITASGGRTFTFVGGGTQTLTVSSGSLITDGYKVGMLLTIAGTSSNNQTLRITTLSATVIGVASGFTGEGPISSTATLNATPDVLDPT